ncbi:MAG: hypothetical protein J6C96_03815 [Oscillospiraceae bacterium]|nr:hypothetical protein [Oscillospiraceae bacterium]
MSLNGILERDFCVLRVIFLRFARQATTNVTAKVYVIDDGDHSTMLLAEEY